MPKNKLFTVLLCLNLILAAALVFHSLPPRTAAAQGTGLGGNFLAVTGEIQSKFDALYLMDLQNRTLHVFYFQKGSQDLQYAGYRDLERDFRNN